MSIGTIVGIVGGLGLFFGSIMLNTNQYSMFWSPSSVLMVFGGTIAATFIAYKENYAMAALKGLLEIFKFSILKYLIIVSIGLELIYQPLFDLDK